MSNQLAASPPQVAITVASQVLSSTVQGLLRCGLMLLTLSMLSFSIHHVLVDFAGNVAVQNGPAGISILVVAITARLALIAAMALVAAHHITVDGRPLLSFDLIDFIMGRDQGEAVEKRWRDYLDNFMLALVPMVLLYAAWQLVNSDLHQFLLHLNSATLETPDLTNNSNINFRTGWQYYIPWAAGAWLIKVAFEKLRDRTGRRVFDLFVALTEVAWIVLTWLVFTGLINRAKSWWTSREVVDWWRDAVAWLDDLIPVFNLPDVIATAWNTVYGAVSLVAGELMVPVIWVGIVGLVLGWGAREAQTIEGTRLQQAAEQRWESASERNRYLADLFTRELREKYLPVIAMARLLWRVGLIALLTIAVLFTIGGVLGEWLEVTIANAADRDGRFPLMEYESVERLVLFALEPIRICFLVATFGVVLRIRQQMISQREAQGQPTGARKA